MKCHGPECKVTGLKNLCLTYKMCGKCCSRVECLKHPSDIDADNTLEDGKSIGDRRNDARKADAVKALSRASLDLHKERERASLAGVA